VSWVVSGPLEVPGGAEVVVVALLSFEQAANNTAATMPTATSRWVERDRVRDMVSPVMEAILDGGGLG
jgi:hypothetical protein